MRGIDSTGMAAIPFPDSKVGPVILKSTVNSIEFLDRNSVRRAIATGQAALMGHTRWRTVGEINRENAQPFEYDQIIGTHNGTLSWGAKNLLEGKEFTFPTDSAALYYHIDKFGLESALEKMDDRDAMALVWWERDNHQLHLYRNNERTLWYAVNKKHDTFYWASESGMLYLALNRNKVDFKKVNRLEPFEHLVVDLPAKDGIAFSKPIIKTIKMKKWEAPKVTYTSYSAKDSTRVFRTGQREIPFVPSVTTSAGPSTNALIKFEDIKAKHEQRWKADTLQPRAWGAGGPFYKTPRGQVLGKEAFEEKVNEGCAINGEVPVFGEPVKFLNDGSFICGSCLAMTKSGKDSHSTELVLSML